MPPTSQAPKYYSTRASHEAKKKPLELDTALLNGLAPDAGLYMPSFFPKIQKDFFKRFQNASYEEAAHALLYPYLQAKWTADESFDIIAKSFQGFRLKERIRLQEIQTHGFLESNKHAYTLENQQKLFILELFHGPSYAFKDFGLGFLAQTLARLHMDKPMIVLAATSGDTGAAAITAFQSLANCQIVVLHPNGKIAERQRRQMTTTGHPHVHPIAVDGNFDDCQSLVKKAFQRNFQLTAHAQKRNLPLISVNSINWGRLMAQMAYYAQALLNLYRQGFPVENQPCSFVVPTGNFGDAYAGSIAAAMGLPISTLLVATNTNNILHTFFSENSYSKMTPLKTLSPSMDIAEASNFERLLSRIFLGDGQKVLAALKHFQENGSLVLPEKLWLETKKLYSSQDVSDDEVLQIIKKVYTKSNYLLDPHTAVGFAASLKHIQAAPPKAQAGPVICLSTAHPAKFPEAIQKSGLDITGPALSHQLSPFQNLMQKEENLLSMKNSETELFAFLDSLPL